MIGFVYLWIDSAKSKRQDEDHIERYYIGAHWGHEQDGYVCSSNWMRNAKKRRPNDFKRIILKTNIQNKKELMEEEHKWLQTIEDYELGKRYYNLRNCRFPVVEHSEITKQSISEKKKGKTSNRKGIILSEEVRKKISEGHKGQIAWNKGKKMTEKTKEKVRIARQNQICLPHSEETKRKIRETIKNTLKKKKEKNEFPTF
jgi:hypothetical protein